MHPGTLGMTLAQGLQQSMSQSLHMSQIDEDLKRDHEDHHHQVLDQGGLIGVSVVGGSGQVSWRNFEDARAFVRAFKMQDQKAWRAWSKSGSRPQDIPSHPDSAYADSGWLSWRDWLGTSQGRAPRATKQKWKSFHEAREFVRSLQLDNQKDWRRWSAEHRPSDIPSHPHTAYKTCGWLSWRDWLGTAEGKPPRKSRVLVRKNRESPAAQDNCLEDDPAHETDPVIEIAASFTNGHGGSSVDALQYQTPVQFAVVTTQDRLQDEEAQCWIDMGKKEHVDPAQDVDHEAKEYGVGGDDR